MGHICSIQESAVKTTNAGMTWSPLTSGTTNALYDVYFFDGTQGVAVGEQGLIRRTTDGGAGWQTVASGVKDGLRSVSFSGVNGIAGGDSETILYSTDAGASWHPGQTGFFGPPFFGAYMLNSTTGFVAGQNLIFQPLVGNSTDGGASWDFHAFYFDNNEGGCTDLFFFDQSTGVVSGTVFDGRGAIARTTDGGTNWSTSFFDQAIQGIDFPQPTSGFAVGAGGTNLKQHGRWNYLDRPDQWDLRESQRRFLRQRRVARDRSWRQRHDPMDGKRRRTGADTNAHSNS